MVLGLTGQTGSGKTYAADIIRSTEGCYVIDCDKIARLVVEKGTNCLVDLALEFSPLIIDENGCLNRRKLAKIVFNDSEKLARMNEIMFPYIIEELEERIEKAKRANVKLIVLDAPTLFESGAYKLCDRILVVTADEDIRLARIIERDGLSLNEAKARMESQYTQDFFLDHADYVIYNNKSKAILRVAVLELLNRLGI